MKFATNFPNAFLRNPRKFHPRKLKQRIVVIFHGSRGDGQIFVGEKYASGQTPAKFWKNRIVLEIRRSMALTTRRGRLYLMIDLKVAPLSQLEQPSSGKLLPRNFGKIPDGRSETGQDFLVVIGKL